MKGLPGDIRYSLRRLLSRPGLTALAISALALGIGLSTTMFSIVQGAILRGLPFDESDRILHVAHVNPLQGDDDFEIRLHDYVDYRDRQTSFSDFGAFLNFGANVAGGASAPERFRGARMTPSMLRLLRVAPLHGRAFTDADAQPGAARVVLISHRLWASRFDANPNTIGQVLRINQQPAEIIGIMPPGFRFPLVQDVWEPLVMSMPAKRSEGPTLEVLGRLAPGVSERQATTELATIAGQLASAHEENRGVTTQVKSFVREFLGDEPFTVLYAMLGCVIGVLLIACANVMNLQLARALERTREVAIRTAMGARRSRLVQQILIEGALLSGIGALIGIALAAFGISLFNRAIVDTNPPFWIDIRIDGPVLLFVIAVTAAAALASSLVPALRVTRAQPAEVLKEEGRSGTGLRAGLLSRLLVGGAVTLAAALLLVSGLLIKSVVSMRGVRYEFSTSDIRLGRFEVGDVAERGAAEVDLLVNRLIQRQRAIGGVRGAAIGTGEPGQGASNYLTLEGQTFGADDPAQPVVRRIAVTPDYFDVLRVQPTSGRGLTDADRAGTQPVVVVGADFAARYFPDGRVLGRQIRLSRFTHWPWWTIVGIVPTLTSTASSDTSPTVYVPLAQLPTPDAGLTMLVAGASDAPTAAAVRRAAADVAPDLPITGLETIGEMLARQNWPTRVFGTLFLCFGAAALLMAAAGLYGVLAFNVRRRTQEIGVRMALGAGRQTILRLVLRQALWIVSVGLVVGLTLGLGIGTLMEPILAGVAPLDVTVLVLTFVSLLVVAFVATIVPALRAAAIDPLLALRQN